MFWLLFLIKLSCEMNSPVSIFHICFLLSFFYDLVSGHYRYGWHYFQCANRSLMYILQLWAWKQGWMFAATILLCRKSPQETISIFGWSNIIHNFIIAVLQHILTVKIKHKIQTLFTKS